MHSANRAEKIIILSAFHDYRTKKRASIQALADAYVRLGYDLCFLSTRFSSLSKFSGDSRNFLLSKSNQAEMVAGIECYLWRTAFHPFNSSNKAVKRASAALFPMYAAWPSRDFDEYVSQANYIIIESSVAAIYLRRIRALNPNVKIIYYATDRLDTHGAHPYVMKILQRDGKLIDHCSVRSAQIIFDFNWSNGQHYLAPFGIHAPDFETMGANPYAHSQNAVSVGSGLFDPEFFKIVPPLFPDIDFHVIGCGTNFEAGTNVHIYPEMTFKDTLPYLKYATLGLAPYRWAPAADYIADSSLKLAQFEYLGLPAVCPQFAAGKKPYRFAYTLGDVESMSNAVRQALSCTGKVEPQGFMSWDEVAKRVLYPHHYPDTHLVAD